MNAVNRGRAAVAPNLLILTPLPVERLALGHLAREAHVMQTGMGPERAQRAAQAAGDVAAQAVAVVGFCGGLDPRLKPGDVVVATEVRTTDGVSRPCSSAPMLAALRRLGIERVHAGPIVSTHHIVRDDERAALAHSGAIAVDMESAWLADAARGRPLAVLRAVVDTPERELRRLWSTAVGGIAAYGSLRSATPAVLSWGRAESLRTTYLR